MEITRKYIVSYLNFGLNFGNKYTDAIILGLSVGCYIVYGRVGIPKALILGLMLL